METTRASGHETGRDRIGDPTAEPIDGAGTVVTAATRPIRAARRAGATGPLSERAALVAVLERYGLGGARPQRLPGAAHPVYRLRGDGGAWALHLLSGAPDDHAAQAAWLVAGAAAVAAAGAGAVPAPRAAVDGRLVVPLAEIAPGRRGAALVVGWLPGRAVPSGRISPATLHAWGGLLAALHAAAVPGTGVGTTARLPVADPVEDAENLAALATVALDPESTEALVAAAGRRAADRLAGAGTALGAVGWTGLHGAPTPDRLLRAPGGVALSGVGHAAVGPPAADIAAALFPLSHRPEFPRWSAAFLAGYAVRRPLPLPVDELTRLLPPLWALRIAQETWSLVASGENASGPRIRLGLHRLRRLLDGPFGD